MDKHYKALSAVFPIIVRQCDGKMQVLLHQRANTGYMDGKWDFAGSGHVDEGETAKMAVIRECLEELGITVDVEFVEFVHLSHRIGKNGGPTYYDIYFIVKKYDGIATIAEPNKCSALEWFDLGNLPNEIIDIRKLAIQNYLDAIPYSEIY
ncbi:NUDIX hydrolase [Tissierella simiarum]|nr:NUDIX domain-containing protein [Tissierella simiarum]